MKSTGKYNSSILIRTFSINLRGTFTDQSVNYKVISIGLSSLKVKRSYTELGNKFILAPRSSKALSMDMSPMTQEMMGASGSLSLGESWFINTALTC